MKFSPWKNEARFPRRRLAGEWLIVLVLGLLTTAAAAFSYAGKQASFWAFDHELSWLTPPVDPRILIVRIDEESLAALGRWPWPRAVHSALIDKLSDGGAKIIGYDVLFVEPADATDDDALRSALERSKRVVLPAYVTIPGSNGREYDVQQPLPQFVRAARGVGHVNVVFDSDGLVRRGQMQVGKGRERLAHMMHVVAQAINPALRAPGKEMLIPFNHIGSFSSVSAHQVINGEVPAEVLQGRIVLVGATAMGLGDALAVPGPAGTTMPGVEAQANMVNTILTHSGVTDAGNFSAFLAAAILLSGVLLFYWRMRPTAALILTLAVGIFAIAVSASALGFAHSWISPLPAIAGLTLAYPLWNWRRLSALNQFVEHEARALGIELDVADQAGQRSFGYDVVALSASRLGSVISELADRRRFLRDVIEGAPDAIMVVDSAGNVVIANQIAQQLFGQQLPSSALWAHFSKTGPIHQLSDEEVELIDGRTMLVKSVPLGGESLGPPSHIVRIVDISERKEIERQRSEFLEFLSHDMRAPQSSILRIVDMASKAPDKPVPIDRIRDHAAASLKLADDFVQLARLSAITPNISTIDLRSIAEEAIDHCYEAAKARDVRIELLAGDIPMLVNIDPSLVMRAFCNLLDNAVKYSPENEVVICSLATLNSGTHHRDQVTVKILDHGSGIAPERLTALFKRFGPNDTSHGISSGLGLAFVKRAMDMNGVAIECESSANGSLFTMTFNLADGLVSIVGP